MSLPNENQTEHTVDKQAGLATPTRKFSIGLFFECVGDVIEAHTLEDARRIADKRAEGIADTCDLVISHVEVVEK